MSKEKLNAKDQLYNDLQTEEGRSRLLKRMQTIDPKFTQKVGGVQDILAKVTEQYVKVAKPYWGPLSEQINKVKSCFIPLFDPINKIKLWLHSDDGKEFIKKARLFARELEKAKEKADDIEKILSHGSLGELINIKPINGLTLMFITGRRVGEIKEIERENNEILEKEKEINRKKKKGPKNRKMNNKIKQRAVIAWYQEGKDEGSWGNPTEAGKEHKKWLLALPIVADSDKQKLAKLNSAQITHAGEQKIYVNETDSQHKAKCIVENMDKMEYKPDKEWKGSFIKYALIGIDSLRTPGTNSTS